MPRKKYLTALPFGAVRVSRGTDNPGIDAPWAQEDFPWRERASCGCAAPIGELSGLHAAGGQGKAVDLIFNDIRPEHGVLAIRFANRFGGEAMVQAIEIGPGQSVPGAKPVQAAVPATMPRP